MKCQNMKIFDVLFFLAHFVTIYSAKVQQNSAPLSQSAPLVDEEISNKKPETNCPPLWKSIHDNNLTEYTIDCKISNMQAGVVSAENVLQQACFLARKIFLIVCDSKRNGNPDLSKLGNMAVCPFNFSHIENLGVKLSDFDSVVKALTNKTHCSKVCEGHYSTRNQCAVLSQLNNYLRSQLVAEKQAASVETDIAKPKVQNSANQEQQKEQQPEIVKTKEVINRPKNESDSLDKLEGSKKGLVKQIKEEKTEKISSTLKEQQTPKTRVTESDIQSDFRPPIEDQNEVSISEDAINSLQDQLHNKPDMDKLEKSPPSHPQGKELYPADGLFQAEDSHSFFYFLMVSSVIVVGYLAFHNKNKILAYALEGTSGRRSRRRPNPARYRKLETNLEEVISSGATNSAATNVVY